MFFNNDESEKEEPKTVREFAASLEEMIESSKKDNSLLKNQKENEYNNHNQKSLR